MSTVAWLIVVFLAFAVGGALGEAGAKKPEINLHEIEETLRTISRAVWEIANRRGVRRSGTIPSSSLSFALNATPPRTAPARDGGATTYVTFDSTTPDDTKDKPE